MGTSVGGLLMEAGWSRVLPAGRDAATSAFLYRRRAVLLSIAQRNRHYFFFCGVMKRQQLAVILESQQRCRKASPQTEIEDVSIRTCQSVLYRGESRNFTEIYKILRVVIETMEMLVVYFLTGPSSQTKV